jgi:hypothetical protein
MEPVGKNFFTPREIEWLITWEDEFCRIEGKRLADAAQTSKKRQRGVKGVSQTQEFQLRVIEGFQKEFPYRHPNAAKKSSLSTVERNLTMTTQEWAKLGQVSGQTIIIPGIS